MSEAHSELNANYLQFLYGVLLYLKNAEAPEDKKAADFKNIQISAELVRDWLNGDDKAANVQLCKEVETVVKLVGEYYPLEENGDRLSEAVGKLDETIRSRYEIT